jgi:hypothetical protein
VEAGVCDVCLADLDERAGPSRRRPVPGAIADLDELRFSDVLDEIRAVVDLARGADDGSAVATAGARVEQLLGSLRNQFLRDLGTPRLGSAGAE